MTLVCHDVHVAGNSLATAATWSPHGRWFTMAPVAVFAHGRPRTWKELSSSEQQLQMCWDLVNTVTLAWIYFWVKVCLVLLYSGNHFFIILNSHTNLGTETGYFNSNIPAKVMFLIGNKSWRLYGDPAASAHPGSFAQNSGPEKCFCSFIPLCLCGSATLLYDAMLEKGKLTHWVKISELLLAFSQNVRPTLCGCSWTSHLEKLNGSAFSVSACTLGHRNGPRLGEKDYSDQIHIHLQTTRELCAVEDLDSRQLKGSLRCALPHGIDIACTHSN